MKSKLLSWLEAFVVQLEADGRSHHTIGQYRRHVRLFAAWVGEQRIGGIDHQELARFLTSDEARLRPDGKPKKPVAMNALRTSLRCFFAYLNDVGLIEHNPARRIRRAMCGAAPPRALTEDELGRLRAVLEGAPERDRVLFTLMLRTGVRLGSALALDIEDVDTEVEELFLRTAKGGREERVFVPADASTLLDEWIGRRVEGPLFPGRASGRLSRRHARRQFRKYLVTAKISRVKGTHTLRHSFATRLYRRTGDVLVTQAALCHRSIASTLVYAEVCDTRIRSALGA